MGHQITFYMTPSDLESAMKRIAACGDFVILHSRSPESHPRVISTIDFVEEGRPWLYFYVTHIEYLQLIKMREVPAQRYWAIDSLRSPVVELNRSSFDGKNIGEGRFYFEDSYYDEGGQKVSKPTGFLGWAKCTLAAAKRTLKRDRARDAYVGVEALSAIKHQGGALIKSTAAIASS
jgi:hypothetical protein